MNIVIQPTDCKLQKSLKEAIIEYGIRGGSNDELVPYEEQDEFTRKLWDFLQSDWCK